LHLAVPIRLICRLRNTKPQPGTAAQKTDQNRNKPGVTRHGLMENVKLGAFVQPAMLFSQSSFRQQGKSFKPAEVGLFAGKS
jgi:hypothetical protein